MTGSSTTFFNLVKQAGCHGSPIGRIRASIDVRLALYPLE